MVLGTFLEEAASHTAIEPVLDGCKVRKELTGLRGALLFAQARGLASNDRPTRSLRDKEAHQHMILLRQGSSGFLVTKLIR
jgi:hypothetical protein